MQLRSETGAEGSDAEMERLLARDEEALNQVTADNGAGVHGIARRVLVDPAVAEEVAQDAFLALWRRPGAFDPARGRLQTFHVARNKAVDAVRREEVRRRTKQTLLDQVETSMPRAEEDHAVAIDRWEAIKAALAELPPLRCEALVSRTSATARIARLPRRSGSRRALRRPGCVWACQPARATGGADWRE